MSHPSRTSIIALAAVMALVLLAATPMFGQAASVAAKPAPAGKAWTPPRTADGKPDLQGIWSNATSTPLERNKNLGAKEFYTPEELAANAARAPRRANPAADGEGTLAVHYDLSQFGLDRRDQAVNLRTSLIVGPEGRVPALLPAAQKRQADRQAYQREHGFDSAQNRGLSERCITWPNEGPPMLSPGYNSNLQVVQGPGYVAIVQEMIHDVRIIPTDGSPHIDKSIHQWFGDSRGHWEGNTLVVETTNFSNKANFRGSDENLKLIERFTRTGPDTLMYEFTVNDPTAFTKPFTGQIPMYPAQGPILEYACNEGNYAMTGMLAGARAEEKASK